MAEKNDNPPDELVVLPEDIFAYLAAHNLAEGLRAGAPVRRSTLERYIGLMEYDKSLMDNFGKILNPSDWREQKGQETARKSGERPIKSFADQIRDDRIERVRRLQSGAQSPVVSPPPVPPVPGRGRPSPPPVPPKNR